nr:hypothetical protein [Chloroflexota bacterium]
TLGGNVAHALPAADGTIALLALDAWAEVAGIHNLTAILGSGDSARQHSFNRLVPLKDLFLGPGKSSLKHGEELIVGFHLSLSKPHQASCFRRIMRPQGVALPILNCAVWLDREEDIAKGIRIAVGPGGGTPFNAESFEYATEALLAQAQFRTSARRAGADYRQHLVVTLFRDTFKSAWERAVPAG